MSVIRKNRIAVSVAAGLAVVLGLGLWTSYATGAQSNTPVAQVQPDKLRQQAQADDGYGTAADPDQAGAQAPAATTTEAPAAAPVSTIALQGKTVDKMGEVVQDGDGRTLYRFDKDVAKPAAKTNCVDACATTWPPLLSPTVPTDITGVDPDLVGLVERPDGQTQVTIDDWPVYTYSKDDKPGAWKGQGVGGTWFVIQPDGKRNVECLPAGVTPPVA
ncbi:hypothetical protein [Umezawaea beigongshangensis]|uniref:hypothetical protein n=1 Tax=Umezawaea beigongshangensis TaxID=2780383 RepID=UPI001E5DDDE8|nr:hypothetical protein [Umezawaea beigongshangensis]